MKSGSNEVQLQLERDVLAALLFGSPSQPERIMAAMEGIELSDFTLEAHRLIYTVAVELFVRHNGLDVMMLNAELQKQDLLEKVGGVIYLTELSDAFTAAGYEYRYAALRALRATELLRF